jgi:hypothetical protein
MSNVYLLNKVLEYEKFNLFTSSQHEISIDRQGIDPTTCWSMTNSIG